MGVESIHHLSEWVRTRGVILSNSGEPEAREWPRSDRPGVVDVNPGLLPPGLPGHAFPHTVLSQVPPSSAAF